MKGVIIAGGTGTRLMPITRIINKHLLPVGCRPMIYWSLEKLKEAGIHEILIVTNKKDEDSFKALLGNGQELGIELSYNTQEEEGSGIADAIKCARDFVEDKFIVLLGDNLFDDDLSIYIDDFEKSKKEAKVLLKEVPDPERYGVAILDETNHSIKKIIEKPQNPISNYCVTGIYFYNKQIFDLIDTLKSSDRGELEVTDLNNLIIDKNELYYGILPNWWLDAGTFEALFEANKHFFENGNSLRGN